MWHNDFQMWIAYQYIMCYHVEYRARGLGQIFIAGQRHIGNQLSIERRGFVRVQDDDGVLLVEIGHQRVQSRVTEVLSVAVGSQLDAICTQDFQGIASLLQCVWHIGQRQGCTKHETSKIACLQCSALFIVATAHRRRSLCIAKSRLWCGHGQHSGLNASLVHKGDMLFRIPSRNRETFVHLGTVGFDVIEVALSDGVAVKVDLCQGWQYWKNHKG